MRTITISDLHGHDSWMKIACKHREYDRIIFIGDFVDSKTLNNDQIRENLLEIIEFKKAYTEKVVLLLGNHDNSYLYFPDQFYRAEGFRAEAQPDLTQIFSDNRKLFQVAFQFKKYLWTHAGVSNKWYNWMLKTMLQEQEMEYRILFEASENTIAETFNLMDEASSTRKYLHEIGSSRLKFGSAGIKHGGITWSDRSETNGDFLNNYFQICGHTPINRITTIEHNGSSITYTDCLGEYEEFYELEIK